MPLTIPDYIEIRTTAGAPAAYLSPEADGLKDCYIDQHLNAECTLTFLLPMDNEKWAELTTECRIRAGGREFIILRPDAVDVVRDGQKLWGKVMAAESWVLLNKQYPTIPAGATDLAVIILSSDPGEGGFPAGSAGSALYRLLQGSGWSVGTVDITGIHDLETEKESLLANIQKVQEVWGGHLVWDSINKIVSLRAESTWQNYTGFQVRYAKNLKTITRTINYDIITRLYPFGENDLDISSVNSGVKYLENFSYTGNAYVGIYQNQDIDNPQELKDKATEVLAKLCQPRYTYRVDMVDLRTLPEYQHEDFALGDMVDIIDEDMGVNVRARVIRHKYNVFQPWKCELEIGEPEERLAAKLTDSFDVAKFVREALRPNPATLNLLKGFINTFATQINSANGKLAWNDSILQTIEIDQNGNETGKRVRITPGGIGISTDGGQTYVTAMTGAGILANTVIVNALYALTTEDGYTKLTGSGLEVWDNQATPKKRLHAGQYQTGKFGLELRDKTGNMVILNEDGILQTWEQPREDNVDSSNPLVFDVYIPPETVSIRKALLRLRLKAFRAYETGAASGGGSTSGPSSINTTVSADENIDVTTYLPFYTYIEVDTTKYNYADADNHSHGGSTSYDGLHNHGIPNGTVLVKNDGGTVTFVESGNHSHSISTSTFDGSSHLHKVYDHGHRFEARGHSHGMSHIHSTPDHTHPLNFGIYTSTPATGITVKINGVDRTADLGGPFNSDQTNLNIASYLSGQWNAVELGSSQLGRISSTIFIQTMMGV
jgi:phage minor structural protein